MPDEQAMPVPYFGLAREFEQYGGEILGEIGAALGSGRVLQGPAVVDFEEAIASRVGRRRAIAVSSCTDALYFALAACGVQPGDEILVTDFSFVASASPILRLGATPVFVDINPVSLAMDLEHATSLLTPRVRGVVAVHLYGRMMSPSSVENFANQHGLILIEDAAQAIGAMSEGRRAGSLGLASCISFDPTKPISAPGSAGVVLTDDVELAARVRRLRYHGKDETGAFVELGYNSQMPTLTAAVLRWKLDRMEEWTEHRQAIARRYARAFKSLAVELPNLADVDCHIVHKFVIRSPNRDRLRAFLADQGVETLVHYRQPLHAEPCFHRHARVDPRGYPNSDAAAAQVMSLPIHALLTEEELETVIASILAADRAGIIGR